MFVRNGTVCIARFGPAEAAVLNEVMLEVITLLSEGFDRADPVIARLFPDVYRDDPATSRSCAGTLEDDLRSAKLEQAALLLDALPVEGGEVALDEEQAEAWLRALTDVRLALGPAARASTTTTSTSRRSWTRRCCKDPTSARVGQLSVYQYLTYLQESLVGALMG